MMDGLVVVPQNERSNGAVIEVHAQILAMGGPDRDRGMPHDGLALTQLRQQSVPELRDDEPGQRARRLRAEQMGMFALLTRSLTQDDAAVRRRIARSRRSCTRPGAVRGQRPLEQFSLRYGLLVSVALAAGACALSAGGLLFIALDMSYSVGIVSIYIQRLRRLPIGMYAAEP